MSYSSADADLSALGLSKGDEDGVKAAAEASSALSMLEKARTHMAIPPILAEATVAACEKAMLMGAHWDQPGTHPMLSSAYVEIKSFGSRLVDWKKYLQDTAKHVHR